MRGEILGGAMVAIALLAPSYKIGLDAEQELCVNSTAGTYDQRIRAVASDFSVARVAGQ